MRSDLYTKAVLTIIALALLMIACNQYVQPSAAQAEGPFASVQFSGSGTYAYFDTRTGDLWEYWPGDRISSAVKPKWTYLGKITKLGQPLIGAVEHPDR